MKEEDEEEFICSINIERMNVNLSPYQKCMLVKEINELLPKKQRR